MPRLVRTFFPFSAQPFSCNSDLSITLSGKPIRLAFHGLHHSNSNVRRGVIIEANDHHCFKLFKEPPSQPQDYELVSALCDSIAFDSSDCETAEEAGTDCVL